LRFCVPVFRAAISSLFLVFIVLFIKFLVIGALLLDLAPPAFVLHIPPDCPLQAVLELHLAAPAEGLDLAAVHGVTPVVAQAVGDELDQVARLGQALDDPAGDLDVPPLVVRPDVVGLAEGPAPGHELDRPAVVVDVQPVADVHPLAVERERAVLEGVGDEQRDEFLGVLERAVVVARPDDHHRCAVGHVVGVGQAVRPDLAGRVGRGGIERIGLLEKSFVAAAVDLVGRDVEEELDPGGLPDRLEEDVRPVDVGHDELAGVEDRAVDVRLGSEMEDALDVLQDAADKIPVADVAPDELVADVASDVVQVVEVAGVGQLVEVDDPDVGICGQEEMDEVAADESGPAGDEDGLAVQLPLRRLGRGFG
jgi:hypothetical protein